MQKPSLGVFCTVTGAPVAGHHDAVVDVEDGAQAVILLELAHLGADDIPGHALDDVLGEFVDLDVVALFSATVESALDRVGAVP